MFWNTEINISAKQHGHQDCMLPIVLHQGSLAEPIQREHATLQQRAFAVYDNLLHSLQILQANVG